ncbi:MAG TPA: ATP-dependent DNA helicase RecG [Terriglobales bacterium]|nr:ATP-dependent DNA helicase RecG [Terriglobales bacterium]
MLELHTPVQYVKGIGPKLAEILAGKGIRTVEDLLYYLPFRYEDRINPRHIADLRPGEMATIIAEVRGAGLFRTPRRGIQIFQMTAGQGRDSITCLWFNAAYLKGKFKPGQTVALYGRVEEPRSGRNRIQLMQPQFEILNEPIEEAAEKSPKDLASESLEIGRIVPIYESAAYGRLSPRWFRRVVHRALEDLTPDLPDGIPRAIRRRLDLIPRREAFHLAHFPEAGTRFEDLQNARTPAHRRLIFEELFFLEVGLELKRRNLRAQPGISFAITDGVRDAIKRALPFHPTAAQKRVLKEIADDMQRPSPMRRLLQGDVGSGKTIVALEAAIIAIENGYQAALMAPTEILATQHYLSARRLLEPTGYRIALLTGSLDDQQKRDTRRHIARGDVQLVIGTHALIEDKVEFARPGLVIVDEQHRFGVLQRFKLMKKSSGDDGSPAGGHGRGPQAARFLQAGVGSFSRAESVPKEKGALAPDTSPEPDVLVMTATPIPRTLALSLYGDLDVSILDELPPGRTPVVTRRISDERATEVWDFLRKQVAKGQQAFVVYPVIEEKQEEEKLPNLVETGRTGLKAAIKMYDELRRRVFPELRVGLIHGRLSADEKDEVMRRFQRGEIDVLVATTVIEVGVDVPNASVMVVEHAERFGLAQLHQLRGRIGRGAAKSYCILMTGGKVTAEAEHRLDAMVRTSDGFQIAELDLELRGWGEIAGTRQAGAPSFRVANPIRDRQLLELAKREAAALVSGPPEDISAEEVSRSMVHLKTHWERRYGLVEVG